MTERFSLKGQVAIVTGASRGLGYEMAKAIAESGVDYISSSQITMSASTFDIGLDIELE